MTATVSIVVPNYNHAQFLPTALGAICAQTRQPDEVLVLDDASTDASVSVIRGFQEKYPFVRLIQHSTNRGTQEAVNRLLTEAQGRYLVCAAADDQLLPTFLERSLEVLTRYPNAKLCLSEFVVTDTDGQQANYSRNMPDSFGFQALPEFAPPSLVHQAIHKRYLWLSGNTAVTDRLALIDSGAFIRSLEWHSDWFAFYAILVRHGTCIVNDGLAAIRVNPGGYSDLGMKDAVRQRRVLRALADVLARPQYRDLRRLYRRYPAALSVFGEQLASALVPQPRHWDLLIPYATWLVDHHRRINYLNWPQYLKRHSRTFHTKAKEFLDKSLN